MELIAEHRRRCDQWQPFTKPIHLTSVNSFSLCQAESIIQTVARHMCRGFFYWSASILIDLWDCPLVL
ncbi:hypothetical protein T4B_5614 [Trichinella pseudospiralis]|uniref:Uncharacterized protein n=2 Tax=Trichinella pseudospiralis TaxID=6337 RepID=A0A0V1FHQ5_TRIPS|nr:hypothetical protein T4E_12139 [Trichinella pseudospiralis]KRY69762.1 hypothetical protein T4A_11500 [Trichinella pseudospiralis]KRY85532.1 hypothetical protein T4D_7974 [Trichinella pseudospiralis]KRZ24983.1 hypothetical protein T4B_5614 [Trichinella pseudospiralis]